MLNTIPKKYNVGVIAPRNFNESGWLLNFFENKEANIGHIFTNDVEQGGQTVIAFCLHKKIPVTIYPIGSEVGAAFITNKRIIENSDFVLIIDNGISKNVAIAEKICLELKKKYKKEKYNGNENAVGITN